MKMDVTAFKMNVTPFEIKETRLETLFASKGRDFIVVVTYSYSLTTYIFPFFMK